MERSEKDCASRGCTSSSITPIQSRAFDLELTEPFGISGGTAEVARIAIVEVKLADGSTGIGEAAPLPAYNGETVEHALSTVSTARELWLEKNGAAWRERALAPPGRCR